MEREALNIKFNSGGNRMKYLQVEQNEGKYRNWSIRLLSAATIGVINVSSGALAQEDLDNSGAKSFVLDEIVVTAQKRTQNVTEVPISIATVGAEDIAMTGVRQLKDIAEYVPNLTISSGNDFTSTVSIRGVGSSSRNIGFDARVGVYVDGVYLGQSPALNQELLDLERIEVLRGPQGTLFGKNTVAGAINLISKKPHEEFSGTVGLEIGNLGTRQYSGTVNIPLSDKVFTKFSINKQQRDGLVENLVTNHKLNEQDGFSYRAQMRVIFSDSFEANLAVDGLKSDRFSYSGEPVTNTRGTALDVAAPERDQVRFDVDPFEERDIRGEMLTLDWEFGDGYALKSISAHRDTEIQYINDVDYSSDSVVMLDYRDQYDQLSQELQLISPSESDFQYVAGLYYYRQDGHTNRQPVVGDDAISVFTGVPRSVFEGGAALGDPTSIFLLGLFQPGTLSTIGDVETESYAAFLNGSYQITDALKFGFGFRYSIENKDVDWAVSSFDPDTGVSVAPVFGIGNGTVIDRRQDKDFSPMLSLNYLITPDINAYFKYATGYKSGGFNVDFLTQNQLDAGIEFDKETVDSYEIGVKGDLMENRLRFSLAAFLSQYDDYQVQQFIDLGGGATSLSIRNAAKVETKGLEFDLTWLATENLLLTGSLGLLDGKFTSFPGGGTGGADISGNKLPGASDYSFNLSAQYNYPVSVLGAELVARLDYNYRGSYFSDVNNKKELLLDSGDTIPIDYVNGYGILNGRIGLQAEEKSWKVFIWARNLTNTDRAYDLGRRDFLGTRRNFYITPRTYGVELEYTF